MINNIMIIVDYELVQIRIIILILANVIFNIICCVYNFLNNFNSNYSFILILKL